MKQETLNALSAPFNVKTKPGKGNYKYIDSKDVMERMNTVFQGRWSTVVTYKEVIEDHVLVEVLVKAYDDELQQWVEHSGFGSSQIARFTYGDNQGKPLDIGNIYKGALSKAIRSACTRFGAGLTLEVSSGSEVPVGTTSPPTVPSNIPEPTGVSELPALPSSSAPVPPPGPETVPEPEPVPEPVVEEPVVEAPPVPEPEVAAPPVPPAEVPALPVETAPPVRPDNAPMTPTERIKEKKAKEVAPPTPTESVPSIPTSEGVDYMSDVQYAALEGVLGIRGLEYMDLAKEAFTSKGWSSDDVPTDPRKLKYEQAVVVIKYGNDKNRQLA